MKCIEMQSRISDWVDGDPAGMELESHLRTCQACASFHADVTALKQQASTLDLIDPPGRLWNNLRSQLVSEGVIRVQAEKQSFWRGLLSGVWIPSLKPAFSGAILALLFSTAFFYYYVQRDAQPAKVSSEAQVFQELRQAELHYQQAIEALSEVSRRKIETLDPAMAQILNDNLATMDYYVKECQNAVKSNPDNPLVHRYLLTAYQKKIEIMQSIVNSDVL
ncbi:MAG: zf-HC2 domain-containing protein [Acidimicrobiia bacterium]|nr:zf-HC2 domain-containing protein [Acidimicrobiia bacterium]